GEIGRAQALQARAAGIEPVVAMNPVLLKPEGEMRSQRVLLGKVCGVRDARQWHAPQDDARQAIANSLRRLRADADLVLIEGAGSPAELNLLDGDLANMHTARLAEAPVLLAADIERGGVFAALYGTLALLQPQDRARIAGLIVNRFRGDAALFAEGITLLEQWCRRPVLGVVPYLEHLALPIEDSQSIERLAALDRADPDAVPVAVVVCPRVANLDDVLPLLIDRRFRVSFAYGPGMLNEARLVLLPGSKATTADLVWLRDRGFDTVIRARHAAGAWVVGICGGYQMLGRSIDHAGLESGPRCVDGIGLLPVATRYRPEKIVRRVRGKGAMGGPLAGAELVGYEIHQGRVVGDAVAPLADLTAPAGEVEGAYGERTIGTSIHGLFDATEARDALARLLGAPELSARSFDAILDAEIDRWADHLAEHLDLVRISRVAGVN
ncbi:MAG: cobyric acid synthase, partial [Candidatus Dadabacteria bacterium]